MAVREWGDHIVFLRKIVPGGTDKSYGIQVARLAGLPAPVLKRAKEVLRQLEEDQIDDLGTPKLAKAKQKRKRPRRSCASSISSAATTIPRATRRRKSPVAAVYDSRPSRGARRLPHTASGPSRKPREFNARTVVARDRRARADARSAPVFGNAVLRTAPALSQRRLPPFVILCPFVAIS
ncbi:MAG: hypothetical protein WDO13_13945 [Verrucomicrobiota bacterium]